MPKSNATIAPFQALATRDPSLNWYAIADSAQHKDLPGALLKNGAQARCLLGAPQGSPVARHAPHLVSLESPLDAGSAWSWIHLNVKNSPCLSIVATRMSFDKLFRQLAACTEVVLPDGDAMFFAFWDPAILGTLIGQVDDETLHVKGPVLDPMQQAMLTSLMALWSYWDRDGNIHSIALKQDINSQKAEILSLAQRQVDDLVEASVPDHILYYLELNHPNLISDILPRERYITVRRSLAGARELGLFLMGDLVNYVCIEAIYKTRLHTDALVINLLKKVKRKEMIFADALNLFQ